VLNASIHGLEWVTSLTTGLLIRLESIVGGRPAIMLVIYFETTLEVVVNFLN
jgi:hypothetical protein